MDEVPPDPFLSVIVPFHNRDDMLNELIETIPDRQDIEIILVDDKSDEEVTIRRTFQHAVVRMLATPEGKRYAGTARNVGLSVARGTYIFFCDSDDRVNAPGLIVAMEAARQLGGDIIYTYATSFRDDGKAGRRHAKYRWLVGQFMATGDADPLSIIYPPWAKLIRRKFIESNDLKFEGVRVSNDVVFHCRMCVSRPDVRALPVETYEVREGNPSLTSNRSVESIVQRLEVMRRANRVLADGGLRRYRLPAIAHLRRIMRASPAVAFREALRSVMSGTPIVFVSIPMTRFLFWRVR